MLSLLGDSGLDGGPRTVLWSKNFGVLEGQFEYAGIRKRINEVDSQHSYGYCCEDTLVMMMQFAATQSVVSAILMAFGRVRRTII